MTSLPPRVGVGGGVGHDPASSPTSVVYGPLTWDQTMARLLRHYPYGIPIRPVEPSCIGCGRTGIRCCEMAADVAA